MRTPVETTVRLATLEDAERINQLSKQLGYPSTCAETKQRLVEICSREDHAVFLASNGGALIGWIHVLVSASLLSDTGAEIAGLIVDEHHRSLGIGRVLMAEAEQWARNKGCHSVRLRSNVVRFRAHAFYEKLGYRVIKTQHVFHKELAV